eukprot:snap_masked-scaffold_11-processed-gene-4.35-mRNA-1 protein AED:1.00 eAED:1.00 QI:0/-1/0/0/-1/1/1/0/92
MEDFCPLESAILVGNLYNQMYLNPSLNSETWKLIHQGFHKDCLSLGVYEGLDRREGELRNHFDSMIETNVGSKGNMFRSMHALWKDMGLKHE